MIRNLEVNQSKIIDLNKKKILIQSKKKVKKYRIIKEKCKTNMNHKRMVKNNSKIIITINKNN